MRMLYFCIFRHRADLTDIFRKKFNRDRTLSRTLIRPAYLSRGNSRCAWYVAIIRYSLCSEHFPLFVRFLLRDNIRNVRSARTRCTRKIYCRASARASRWPHAICRPGRYLVFRRSLPIIYRDCRCRGVTPSRGGNSRCAEARGGSYKCIAPASNRSTWLFAPVTASNLSRFLRQDTDDSAVRYSIKSYRMPRLCEHIFYVVRLYI